MGRTTRQTIEIEQRQHRVSALYVKGWSQLEIAAELNCCQATISRDLTALRNEWRASRIRNIDEAVAVELRKLEHLERKAWSAWEQSQQPVETTKVTQDDSGKKAEKVVKQRQGNPQYLGQVHRCIVARLTLLGTKAFAPTTTEGEDLVDVVVDRLSLAQLKAIDEVGRIAEEEGDGRRLSPTSRT